MKKLKKLDIQQIIVTSLLVIGCGVASYYLADDQSPENKPAHPFTITIHSYMGSSTIDCDSFKMHDKKSADFWVKGSKNTVVASQLLEVKSN